MLLGVTRTEIQLTLLLVVDVGLLLEATLGTLSWLKRKVTSLGGETIDTEMIFVGAGMLIAGWPVQGSNDMTLRWIVSLLA